jgi:hypothetical protein
VTNLVVDNLMVDWPAVGADGKVDTPEPWRFALKAANGGYDYYPRERFNTDTIPDFAVLWGRDVRGGYIRAPLARAPRDSAAAYQMDERSRIEVLGCG